MLNVGDLLKNAAGMIGGIVNGIIGGVVNVATPLVSAAATLADGAVIGVGEGVVAGSGATVTGITNLIDVLCGYVRGAIGTIGGFLNNGVVEVVKVVGGEDESKELPKDPDFKKHFGDFGSAISSAIEKSGGLSGVRSLLAWPSKAVNWGSLKNLFTKPGDDKPDDAKPGDKVDDSTTTDKPSADSKAEDNKAEDKPAENQPSEEGMLVWVGADGTITPVDIVDDEPEKSTDLSDELLGDGAAASQPIAASQVAEQSASFAQSDTLDVPLYDGFLAQANHALYDGASAVPVI